MKEGIGNAAFMPDDSMGPSHVMSNGMASTDILRRRIQDADAEPNIRYSQYVQNLESENENLRKERWDVFRHFPVEMSDEGMESFYEFCGKVFRLLTMIVIFIVLLGAAVMSKTTLLFATSQLRPSPALYCKTSTLMNQTHCVSKPLVPPGDTIMYELSCLNKTGDLQKEPVYESVVCQAVTVRWIWSLFLMMVTPYVLVFLRCLFLICFKKKNMPSADVLLLVMIQETLYCVGMSIFVFRVLPYMNDVIQSLALMTGVGFLPGLLRILSRPTGERLWIVQLVLDILAFAAQVSALVMLPVLSAIRKDEYDSDLVWAVPLSLFLMSLSWWENYIDKDTKLGSLVPAIVSFKQKIRQARTKTYLIASLWKIVLSFVLLLAFASKSINVSDLFNWDFSAKRCAGSIGPLQIGTMEWDWLAVWGVNAGVGVAAYFLARTAAKVNIQRISYAIPLVIATPAVFGSLVGMCESWNNDPCTHSGVIPGHVFWRCYPRGGLGDLFTQKHEWLLVVWWISQIWIARHIFFPSNERLMKTERLFIMPLYDNVIIEQWLMHNRARRETKRRTGTNILRREGTEYTQQDLQEELGDVSATQRLLESVDSTPFIYICATMWHENETEMIMLLKSLFRLDIDQCARRNAQVHMDVIDPDYYEFEAHIFFDDAMQDHLMDETKYKCNQFVKLLVATVDTAASTVHECEKRIDAPVKIPTPYGGRLEWTMPGGNKIIAHLKDKAKIRHKKRWSQVMYMYYFLAYKLWAHEPSDKRKQLKADNTYLLALDGDVDFMPKALMKLVDLMKKDEKMGAACGRIHPIGGGPMVWYQKFEYALGHWMQKATEHVFGCVLCSPGCFSLFRGSCIMDDNVMKKYTTMSTEAQHYVQYDQGEDRWLCTLLLQQGYRVEYSAASDSFTFAPEGFNEFYNQRRRWMPSTMANILDLLMSWRHTIKVNENISLLYIMYQTGLMVSSILGSGTIFLMIVGALQLALNGAIDNWASLLINLVPVLLFVVICYKAKSETQLLFAQILTTLYALMQMLVLVGIMIQISKDGPCSPTAIFFFYVAGTFIFAAIIHPQEFFCVIHGFIYFVSIPSMYMLLMMYSLTNLHVVSWGTREVKPTPTEEADAAKKELESEGKKAESEGSSRVTAMIKKITDNLRENKGWSVSIAGWCNFMCCPRPHMSEESVKFEAILAKLDDMEDKYKALEHSVKTGGEALEDAIAQAVEMEAEPSRKVSFGKSVTVIPEEMEVREEMEYDDNLNPFWMNDKDIGDGPVDTIDEAETFFFKDLISTYLFPLEKNKAGEERVAMELLELRNKVSFTYFLLNACFVVVIFTLQANVDKVNVPWPCGDNLRLEPIGFAFLIFFGVMMVVQTIGMIVHRTSTFLHIIATTKLNWFQPKEANQIQDAIALAKDMVRLKIDDNDDRRASMASIGSVRGESLRKRQTVKKLARQQTKRPTVAKNLDEAFQQRLDKLNSELNRESATAEDIGKNVIGRSRTRGKSVRAISNLKSKGRTVGNTPNATPLPQRAAPRMRCDSLPDLEEEMRTIPPATTEAPKAPTGVKFEAPQAPTGVKFQLEDDTSKQQSQL